MACLFCNIADGTQGTPLLYEDPEAVAFKDVNPQAPHHILIIPRKHIATLNDISPQETPLVGHLFEIAQHLAGALGIADSGYRSVINCNAGAGQSVFHLHVHLLGGRRFHWPPG